MPGHLQLTKDIHKPKNKTWCVHEGAGRGTALHKFSHYFPLVLSKRVLLTLQGTESQLIGQTLKGFILRLGGGRQGLIPILY